MATVKHKPTFDEFIGYVRKQFQGMQITDEEVESLRAIFDDVSRDQLSQAFRYANNHGSFNPLSTIIRQLKLFQPSIADYQRQEGIRGATYNYHGKWIEHGTNWEIKNAEARKNRKEMSKQELAKLHQWFVNYDWAMFPRENHHYVKIDDNSDKFFKSLRKSNGGEIDTEKKLTGHQNHQNDPATLKLIREVLGE